MPKEWQEKGNVPKARAGFGFCALDDKFLLIGGANREEGHYDDFWYLKTEERNGKLVPGWQQKTDFEDLDPRTGLTTNYISSSDIVYIFGGQNFINNMHTNQFYKLKLGAWTCDLINTAGAPKPRNSHTSVLDEANKRLVIYGGANQEGCHGDLHFYYYESDKWESKGETSGIDPREMHTAHMWKDNQMIVIGGRTENGSIDKTIYVVDLETNKGTVLKKMHVGLCSHSSLLLKGESGNERLFICGGLLGETFNENLLEFNLENNQVCYMNLAAFESEDVANLLMAGRIAIGFGHDATNESLVVFGGSKYVNEMNDVMIIKLDRFDKEKKLLPYN